jgi:uncharacterized coiled-coil protein SlyX
MKGKDLKDFLRNKGVVMANVARQMKISPQQFSNMLNSKDITTGKFESILKAAGIADFKLKDKFELLIDSKNQDELTNRIEDLEKQIAFLQQQLTEKSDHIGLLKMEVDKYRSLLHKCQKKHDEQEN